MNSRFLSNGMKTFAFLVVSLGLISCVGNNSSSTASSSTNSTGAISTTGTSNDLSLESSPDYAKYSMSNIPIGSFGLTGLQLTNIGNSTINEMQIVSPNVLPEDVTIDYTRTTCYVGINSAANAIKSLAPNQSCNVVLKFEPTKEEAGSLILSMSAKNLNQQSIMISSDTLNFATRNNSPFPIIGKYAYIYGSKPSYCNVYSDGGLVNCQPLETGGMNGVSTLEVYNSHAYLTSGHNNDPLRVCDIASNGNFSNCHINNPSLYDASTVNAIRFHDGHAYVIDMGMSYGYSNINICNIDSTTGDVSDCNTTVWNLSYSWDIAFNGNYAYIRNSYDIDAFPIIDGLGNLGNCTSTAQISGSVYLVNISFNQGSAYVTDLNLGVYRFTLDSTNGALNNGVSIPTIDGLGKSNLAYDIKLDNNYAYIVQPKNVNDSVFRCQIGSDTFTSCQRLLTGISAWGIEFYQQ